MADRNVLGTLRAAMIGVGWRSVRDEEALWRFSLAFYARPGVAEALIALQDRAGLDVNLMLFALWLGVSGRSR